MQIRCVMQLWFFLMLFHSRNTSFHLYVLLGRSWREKEENMESGENCVKKRKAAYWCGCQLQIIFKHFSVVNLLQMKKAWVFHGTENQRCTKPVYTLFACDIFACDVTLPQVVFSLNAINTKFTYWKLDKTNNVVVVISLFFYITRKS